MAVPGHKAARVVPIALILVLVLGVLRGGATSLSKYVSEGGVPPIGYALWQSLVAMCLLFLVGFLRVKKLPQFQGCLPLFLVCGLVGTVFPNVLFFYVVQHVAAGTMAVVLTLVPIITYLVVVLVGQEKPDLIRVIGIALGFSGAVVITATNLSGELELSGYTFLGLLCPLGYSLMSVYTAAKAPNNVHPFYLAAGTHMTAVLFLIPVAFTSNSFHPLWQNWTFVDQLVIGHGILTATAYTLFFIIVSAAGAVYYSFSHYVIAITGLAWGWLIFGEMHSSWFWLAVVLILAGLTLINERQRYPIKA